jgi:hypothetical protein
MILATQEAEIRKIVVWSQPWETGLRDRPYFEKAQHETGLALMSQVVELLPSKQEAQSSNLSTTHKKKFLKP